MPTHQSNLAARMGFFIRTFFAICLLAALSAPAHADKVNLNTADAEALTYIPGIGLSKAQAIVDTRDAMGGFKTMEDVLSVRGIGEKTLETIRQYGTIDGGVSTLTEEMQQNRPERVSTTAPADGASSG